jgi:hypothetical protein
MERKSIKVAFAIVLVFALAGGLAGAGSALAAPITSAQAKAKYASSISAAKIVFLAAVRPSRAAMFAHGKRAEAVRRLAVKDGLAKINAVVAAEKAPSLAAEKTYKASVASSHASPTNLDLKTAVKTNLAALTKATTALKTNGKIAAAHAAFAKIRISAMMRFIASLAIFAKKRSQALARATLRYKGDKAKAYAALQVALKKVSK